MGRPGLTNHRKFRRLARCLGGDVIARGSLEFLWDSCYENGDDYLGDSDDVELTAREIGHTTSARQRPGSDPRPVSDERVERHFPSERRRLREWKR